MGGFSDCCQNESILVQVDDDQAASSPLMVAPVAQPLMYEFEFLVEDNFTQSFNKEFSPEKFLRPPPLKAYLAHRSLII